MFLISHPEAIKHKVCLSVQKSILFPNLHYSPSAHSLHLSPPSLLVVVFIFLPPHGVIFTGITPPSGQMLKVNYTIHQPTQSTADRVNDPAKALFIYRFTLTHTLACFSSALCSHPSFLNQHIFLLWAITAWLLTTLTTVPELKSSKLRLSDKIPMYSQKLFHWGWICGMLFPSFPSKLH